MGSLPGEPATFSFYTSCDLSLQASRAAPDRLRALFAAAARLRCRQPSLCVKPRRPGLLISQHRLTIMPSLLQVQVRVDRLLGCLPAYRKAEVGGSAGGVRPSALQVEARLCSYGEPLGIPARTPWAEAGSGGAAWDTWLSFPLKYRDLGHDAQLALTVWEARDGVPRRALAGTTLRLFSKKGRLKTACHELQLWPGQPAEAGWPSATPANVPVAQRGELG